MNLRHIIYEQNPTRSYSIAILIKDSCFNRDEIEKYYVNPLVQLGIEKKEIVVFNLEYTPTNKAPVKLINNYLPQVLKACKKVNISKLLVADVNYFKVLTKLRTTEPHYGHVVPCKLDKYEDMDVALSLNYASLFYNPTQQTKIDRSLQAIADSIKSIFIPPGGDIIHSCLYPSIFVDIKDELNKLHKYPALTVDVETFGLDVATAGLGTISFAWDQHNGIAFNCNHREGTQEIIVDFSILSVLEELAKFFRLYTGDLIFHGATFDIKILIFQLFMERDMTNIKGLLKGLDVMFRHAHCTKIMTYLATNSTAGNDLKLKHNAAEFAGNWAIDEIKDITKIPLKKLLKYNLVDSLSTWYVRDKYYPIMIKDKQVDIYNEIYRPSMKTVVQMELIGMPLHMPAVGFADNKLQTILINNIGILQKQSEIKKFTKVLQMEALIAKNATLKKLVKTEKDFEHIEFNPNSSQQVGKLLHEFMDFPILDTTDTGLPSVGGDTLKKHFNTLMLQYNLTEKDLQ